MMTELDRSERTTLRRMPDRGHFDRATINSIIDEAMICHVGVVDDGVASPDHRSVGEDPQCPSRR